MSSLGRLLVLKKLAQKIKKGKNHGAEDRKGPKSEKASSNKLKGPGNFRE